MRIALISDIHGNNVALQAVLADLRAQGADHTIFLGDAATIGPQPVEAIETLAGLDCLALITGNHDEALLEPSRAIELQVAANLHDSLNWCLDRLRPAHFDFLRSFRPTFELPVGDDLSLLCYHGSPLSSIDQIISTTAEEFIERFFNGQPATLLAGGHSHIQMLRRMGKRLMINAGSIGNAFYDSFKPGVVPRLLPWAEYAILTVENGVVTTLLRRLPFDTERIQRAAVENKLPSADWWLEQYK